jgi:hypothetical protein
VAFFPLSRQFFATASITKKTLPIQYIYRIFALFRATVKYGCLMHFQKYTKNAATGAACRRAKAY